MTTNDDTLPDAPAGAETPPAGGVSGAEVRGGEARGGLSRRELIGLAAGIGAAGLAVGAGAGSAAGVAVGRARVGASEASVHPFFGVHQAGITTPVQDHLHFASFDMMARTNLDDLIELLQDWTYAAARMSQGLDVSATGAVGGSPEAPPDDTGEALGLAANGLTITFGFGPTLFQTGAGEDRYGIAAQRPAALTPLPAFLGDDLDPLASGGDLFGFKDGTANILADDTAALDAHVWVGSGDEPAWMTGGSYLVARKIAMLIETWDRVRLAEQERVTGRDKAIGAPLSGGQENTAPDFAATGPGGAPAIDARSHVRLAHPDLNGGNRILRRGYNYVDGNTGLGRLDAGLFFLSYQRSPDQFVALQKALATDLLAEYIRHIGSGVWAVPPGAAAGSYVGAGLFDA